MNDNTINADVTMNGANVTVLAGRYRVVRQLGQGGMGSVWLAEDTQLDNRLVAIKMLPSVLVSNKRAYQQLKAEALVSLKLTHPNIATLRAFEENGGNPFLVVDYIDGVTLDDFLAEKGNLSEEETIRLLSPIAAALDYAHSRGVVHRDVKPANVMIATDGTPCVLDFGIAREIQETMTRVTGKLSSGTLMYMSPEQLHGAAPRAAQDVYSFAAMAYECLMGHPPFSRGQVEYQIEHDAPAPLDPHIAISGSVMAGLAKDAESRPTNCAAVLTAGQVKVVGAKRTPASRKPFVVLCVAGVLLVAGLVGFFGWQRWQRQQEAECVRIVEQARIAAERKVAEEKRKADEAEAKRKAAEERKAEEARRISEKAKVERKAKAEAERIAAEKALAESERKNVREATQKAIALFKKGDWQTGLAQAEKADQGDAELLFWLGTCYDIGLGAKCDSQKVVSYFQRAAEKGQVDAQCELGRRYETGWDVNKDLSLAKKWYQAAASQGSKNAEKGLRRLYDQEHAASREKSLARRQREKDQEEASRKARESALEPEKVRALQEEVASLRDLTKNLQKESDSNTGCAPEQRTVSLSGRSSERFTREDADTLSLLTFPSRTARSYYEKACDLARKGASNRGQVKAAYDRGRGWGGPEWPELEAWLDWWR